MDPLKPQELIVSSNQNNTTIQLNVSFVINTFRIDKHVELDNFLFVKKGFIHLFIGKP
jgi:hypothetical protein